MHSLRSHIIVMPYFTGTGLSRPSHSIYLSLGRKTKMVPRTAMIIETINKSKSRRTRNVDILWRCNARFAARGPTAHIMKTVKAPKRP